MSGTIWRREIRHPRDAPRDGSRFLGIRRGEFAFVETLYDVEMGCFAQVEEVYAPFDVLSGWKPLPAERRRAVERTVKVETWT